MKITTSRSLICRATQVTSAALFAVAALCVPGLATSADYPDHPIRLVVPVGAGGGTDTVARLWAQALSKDLGQTLVIENRPGAGGNIGAAVVARANPDGYTLLVGVTGTNTANQFLYSKLPYDPVKDFTPISILAVVDNVVVVPASSSIHTLQDLIDEAKKNPGEMNYGVTNIGSSSHLAVEKLRHDAGIEATAIPYNGAGQATTELLAGRQDFMLDLIGNQIGNIQSGKVRALATAGLKRNSMLPDVPTIAESGYPGFSAVGWIGLVGPAGMPQSAVDKLYKSIDRVYSSPEFQKFMHERSIDIDHMPPEEFAKFLDREREKWGTVVRAAKIKLD